MLDVVKDFDQEAFIVVNQFIETIYLGLFIETLLAIEKYKWGQHVPLDTIIKKMQLF